MISVNAFELGINFFHVADVITSKVISVCTSCLSTRGTDNIFKYGIELLNTSLNVLVQVLTSS